MALLIWIRVPAFIGCCYTSTLKQQILSHVLSLLCGSLHRAAWMFLKYGSQLSQRAEKRPPCSLHKVILLSPYCTPNKTLGTITLKRKGKLYLQGVTKNEVIGQTMKSKTDSYKCEEFSLHVFYNLVFLLPCHWFIFILFNILDFFFFQYQGPYLGPPHRY